LSDKRNLPETEPPIIPAADTESPLPDPNGPPLPVAPGTAGFLRTQSAAVALAVGSAIVAASGGCSYFDRQPTLRGEFCMFGRGYNQRREQPAAVETAPSTSSGVAEGALRSVGAARE